LFAGFIAAEDLEAAEPAKESPSGS